MNHFPAPSPDWRHAPLLVALIAVFLLSSCADGVIASFRWESASGDNLAFIQAEGFPEGKENSFSAARPRNSYTLRKPLEVGRDHMLAVSVNVKKENLIIGLSLSADAKKPGQRRLFAARPGRTLFYLSIPASSVVKMLDLDFALQTGTANTKDETPFAELESISILPAFRGFEHTAKGDYRISDGLAIGRETAGSSLWTLDQPFSGFSQEGKAGTDSNYRPALILRYATPANVDIVVNAGRKIVARCASARKEILIPASVFPKADTQAVMTIAIPDAIQLEAAFVEAVPRESAATVDPGILLLQPPISGEGDFAWYRWDLLPEVLMFDFRDYAIQDAYLKRLAFFVEKKGFAGTLAKDEEIAALHGWNAHDYKTDDIARFFTAAEKAGFPLSVEEIKLKDFLVEKGLLGKKGKEFSGRNGAIISISQESAAYLRHTFLTHESSHAVFFADGNYRDFCISLWNNMTKEEKWFWVLYFGWMNYDISSSYLMANEMQAYLIQQQPRKAQEYFTKILTERLLENHPELEAPLAEYMGKFGSEFEARATILDGWLRKAYGFGAGTTFFLR